MMGEKEKLRLWVAALLIVTSVYLPSYQMDAYGVLSARLGLFFAGLTVAVLLIVFSQSGRIFFNFARESGIELRKVVWPSKEETLKLTGVVFLLVSVITMFLWLVDFLLSSLLTLWRAHERNSGRKNRNGLVCRASFGRL